MEKNSKDKVFDSLSTDVFHLWLIDVEVTISVKQAFPRDARPF